MYRKRIVMPQRFRSRARKWPSERAFASDAYSDRIFGHSSSTVIISCTVFLLYKRFFLVRCSPAKKFRIWRASVAAERSFLNFRIWSVTSRFRCTFHSRRKTIKRLSIVSKLLIYKASDRYANLALEAWVTVTYLLAGHGNLSKETGKVIFFLSWAQFLDKLQNRAF